MQRETVPHPQMNPSWSMEVDLVDQPTPFLMVELDKVVAAYTELQTTLPEFRIHYAVKANPQPEILEALALQGSGFEVASAAELQGLLDRDIRPRDVVFSNPVKAPLDIRMGYDCGGLVLRLQLGHRDNQARARGTGLAGLRAPRDDGGGKSISAIKEIRRRPA